MKRFAYVGGLFIFAVIAAGIACGDDDPAPGTGTPNGQDGSTTNQEGGGSTSSSSSSGGPGALDSSDPPVPSSFTMELDPQAPVAEARRINFAVPLPPNALTSVDQIQVVAGGTPVPTGRRALANWPGGSIRSIQIQFDLAVPAKMSLEIRIGEASTGSVALVPVEQTLAAPNGLTGPSVWAIFPASWLTLSRVGGPALASAAVAGTPAAAWDRVCDYNQFNAAAFEATQATVGNWLFDRPTSLYRGYQRTGTLDVLKSAYREASIYRNGITGTGSATRIPIANDDLKYHYTQGMAIHYLLTGDDRFREAAENVAIRAHDLWGSPGYAGGADFWTERHAGFGLLAYEWAAAVSDDQAATFAGWAATAVDAYLLVQSTYPAGYANQDERCFAHTGESADEEYAGFGCSPWLSAVLADGLDAHADRVARGGDAARAQTVRTSLVKLGAFMANQGRDPEGRPFYWAGVGDGADGIDEYEEHWGESAYLVALAWHWSGKNNAALRKAADDLVKGLNDMGEAGQIRSFNWQCRSGVMAPYYLQP